MANFNFGGWRWRGGFWGWRWWGWGGRWRGAWRDSWSKQMFSAICDDCGEECEVPFKPSLNKPIFCNSCFSEDMPRKESRPSSKPSMGSNDGQLDKLGSKLDKIIKLLEQMISMQPAKQSNEEIMPTLKTEIVEKPKRSRKKVAED